MAHDDGFLSRWSRRKQDVREGRPLDEPPPPAVKVATPAAATPAERVTETETETPNVQPSPTLADVQQLTPESDFTGFMARGVAPDVKNAAMKKLFADPHFNVMDRMDIYIDDYTQPDPLPVAMLRQMASAKVLGLLEDEASSLPKADVQVPPVSPASSEGESIPKDSEI